MRRGIGLRGYAQQDPLNEFKREAFRLYEELRGLIRHGVASSIFRVTVTRQPAPAPTAAIRPWPPRSPGERPRSRGNGVERSRIGDRAAGRRGRRLAGARARVPAAAAVGGSAILRGGRPAAPDGAPMRESLGDQPVDRRRAAARRRRPSGPQARVHADAARGSGATIRAGADRARSTRSATGAERAPRHAPDPPT